MNTENAAAPDTTFTKVQGLGQNKQVVTHAGTVFEKSGLPQPMTIVLSRPLRPIKPVADNVALWHDTMRTQEISEAITNGTITRIDRNGVVINEFRFVEAVPIQYRLVQEGQQLTEEIELAVEQVTRAR